MGTRYIPATSPVAPIPGLEEDKKTGTSDIIGYATGIAAIGDAFNAYNLGQMKKAAYDHQAAIDSINAQQLEIEGRFQMAAREKELAGVLASQNVAMAAMGRRGGSVEALMQKSTANLAREATRVQRKVASGKIATMMESKAKRMAGSSAAKAGLLSGVSTLAEGFGSASKYFTPGSITRYV